MRSTQGFGFPFRAKVGLPRRVTLRFSVRGSDGEHEHALVATMQRRAGSLVFLSATKIQWRLKRLVLKRGDRERVIPVSRVNRTQREDLAMQAERKAYATLGMRIPAEGF